MFRKLADLSYRRTGMEAFGFYLVALSVGLALDYFLSRAYPSPSVAEGMTREEVSESIDKAYQMSSQIVPLARAGYCALVALMVAQAKRRIDFGGIGMVVFSGILGLAGPFVGLLPAAVMTTHEKKTGEEG